MPARRRRFTIEDPIFKTEPLFLIGYDDAQLTAELKSFRCETPNVTHNAGAMLTFDRAPWRVVWTRNRDVAVLVHELYHLVSRICWDKNIAIRARDEFGAPGDETAAYLFEFFSRRALRRLGVRLR